MQAWETNQDLLAANEIDDCALEWAVRSIEWSCPSGPGGSVPRDQPGTQTPSPSPPSYLEAISGKSLKPMHPYPHPHAHVQPQSTHSPIHTHTPIPIPQLVSYRTQLDIKPALETDSAFVCRDEILLPPLLNQQTRAPQMATAAHSRAMSGSANEIQQPIQSLAMPIQRQAMSHTSKQMQPSLHALTSQPQQYQNQNQYQYQSQLQLSLQYAFNQLDPADTCVSVQSSPRSSSTRNSRASGSDGGFVPENVTTPALHHPSQPYDGYSAVHSTQMGLDRYGNGQDIYSPSSNTWYTPIQTPSQSQSTYYPHSVFNPVMPEVAYSDINLMSYGQTEAPLHGYSTTFIFAPNESPAPEQLQMRNTDALTNYEYMYPEAGGQVGVNYPNFPMGAPNAALPSDCQFAHTTLSLSPPAAAQSPRAGFDGSSSALDQCRETPPLHRSTQTLTSAKGSQRLGRPKQKPHEKESGGGGGAKKRRIAQANSVADWKANSGHQTHDSDTDSDLLPVTGKGAPTNCDFNAYS